MQKVINGYFHSKRTAKHCSPVGLLLLVVVNELYLTDD